MRNDHLSGRRREGPKRGRFSVASFRSGDARRFTTDNRPEPSTTKRRARRAP